MSLFIKLRPVSNTCVRLVSMSSVERSSYNILNETEVLNIEDNLENLLKRKNWKDPETYKKINIGFALPVQKKRDNVILKNAHLKKMHNDINLQKLSEKNELKIPLDEVTKEWEAQSGVKHIHAVAEHYLIFDHLFNLAYFYPVVMLSVGYKHEDKIVPVYRGNCVTPTQAISKPIVEYTCSPDSLWTLGLIGLDGHLEQPDGQYLHWLVSNIPGNNINKGNVLCDYVQPMPLRGLGYQRYVFLLYRQKEKLQQDPVKSLSLEDRTFSNLEFYRKHQDNLTPAGLSFFQSFWDESVTKMFHKVYDTKEPIFEYDFDPLHHKPAQHFPKGKPFNLYLDVHRDPKQIAKEYLVQKFKSTDPFQPPPKPLKYTNLVHKDHDKPSWLNDKERRDRNRWGRIKEFLD